MSDEDLSPEHTFLSAQEINPNACLFADISPMDVQQGALGDCWLLAAFASVAEYPEYVSSIIRDHDDGTYSVRLYSYEGGGFTTVEIDDAFPCDGGGNLAYVDFSKQDEIWCCLLEKAFAKLAGGYKQLDGGFSHFAFGMLTGCVDLELIYRDEEDTESWTASPAEAPTSDDPQQYDRYGPDDEPPLDVDELFDLLAKYDRNRYLMCAESNMGSDDKHLSAKNIVQGHAFTILQLAKDPCGCGYNLIKIRNPWGATEWSGIWSDGDDMWSQFPDVADELEYVEIDDGTFWMPIENFVKQYDCIFVCKKNMSSATTCVKCSIQ